MRRVLARSCEGLAGDLLISPAGDWINAGAEEVLVMLSRDTRLDVRSPIQQ